MFISQEHISHIAELMRLSLFFTTLPFFGRNRNAAGYIISEFRHKFMLTYVIMIFDYKITPF